MDKSVLTLRKLPLDSLPKVISWLGMGGHWDKLEHGETEAVKTVEEKVPEWRKQDAIAKYASSFWLRHDNPKNYDKFLGETMRLEIQEIKDDGWLLERVNGPSPLPFENNDHIPLKNRGRVNVRLRTAVAHMGVLG